jgi:hypothetical protein
MIVSSLLMRASLQLPKCASVAFSNDRPTSSLITVPPVSTAISCLHVYRLAAEQCTVYEYTHICKHGQMVANVCYDK